MSLVPSLTSHIPRPSTHCTSLVGPNFQSSTTLEATAIPPSYTGLSYQWYYSDLPGGSLVTIGGATSSTLVVNANGDFNREYKVVVTSNSLCEAEDIINVVSVDAGCGSGNNTNKVQVCHYPPGNQNNPKTICVNVNAVNALIAASPSSYVGNCDVTYEKRGSDETDIVVASIVPNPTTGRFNLSFNSTGEQAAYIRVFDMQGREIAAHVVIEQQQSFLMEFDLTGHAGGIYYVQVIGETKVLYTGKMVKLN